MSLVPLLSAPWHIQVHAFAAMAALVLGIIQFAAPKGTVPHRVIGPVWVILMATVIVSAVFIVHPRAPGEPITAHFTFIHYIFIPLTTFGLVGGLIRIFRGGPDMKRHGGSFMGIFIGGLVIAGFFTFMPGRIMHDVVFDKRLSDNPIAYDAPYLYFLPGAEPPEREVPDAYRKEQASEDFNETDETNDAADSD
ncbi:MAG: hypothetical protein AAFR21_07525 [Pseudomonadota bacterium]